MVPAMRELETPRRHAVFRWPGMGRTGSVQGMLVEWKESNVKNADMPAMPLTMDADRVAQGLTKRERIAMAAMQGLASACEQDGTWSHSPDVAAHAAVQYADALLAELERAK